MSIIITWFSFTLCLCLSLHSSLFLSDLFSYKPFLLRLYFDIRYAFFQDIIYKLWIQSPWTINLDHIFDKLNDVKFVLIKSLNKWTVYYNAVQILFIFLFSSSTCTCAMQICHFSCSFYSSFMLLIKMLAFIPCIVHTQQGFYHLDKSNLLDAQLFSTMI